MLGFLYVFDIPCSQQARKLRFLAIAALHPPLGHACWPRFRLPIFLLRSDQRTGKQVSFPVIANEVARKLRLRAIIALYQAGYSLLDMLYISIVLPPANLQKDVTSLALAARRLSLLQAAYSLLKFL